MTDVERKDDLNLDEVKEEVVEVVEEEAAAEEVVEAVVEEVAEEAAEPEVAEELFCKKCGAKLEAGQEFCPKCGKKVASIEKEDVVAAVSKVGDSLKETFENFEAKAPKGKKKTIVIAAVAVVLVLVLAIAILGGGKDFNDMYGDLDSNYWCTIGSDGSYMQIDTNPYNVKNSFNSTAYYKLRTINEELGFESSVFVKMGQTRALDGRQYAYAGKYSASWTYHPDKGLEVIYSMK